MKSTLRFKRGDFEQAIREALELFPPILRDKMENVEIILEDWPPASIRKDMGIPSRYDLLGLYQGIPRPARDSHYAAVLPDMITLYRGPIEDLSRDKDELRRQIREVLYHEIGHFYGFSEEELEDLERE
ncbi:MAG: metallopeptidase family protein [Smithellaceae bacterium]|nr:metallopeptidase family protein [Smithellaceae bacterium]